MTEIMISFPSFGIELNPSNVAFTVLGKPIYWYGILIALGFLLAAVYVCRRAPQFGLTADNLIDMLIFAVPAAIIGARAYFVIFNWDNYVDNPIDMIKIWEGGLAIYGGIIGGVIACSIFCKVKKISLGAMLDNCSLGLLIGQAIGRWGNFFNRECYGELYDGFLRMGLPTINGGTVYVHPTFLYESLWNGLGLLILHFVSKKFRKFDGLIFLMYIVWYGIGRAMIEGLRTDSLYFYSSNLRVSQVLAIVTAIVGTIAIALVFVLKKPKPENLYINRKLEPEADEAEDSGINEI